MISIVRQGSENYAEHCHDADKLISEHETLVKPVFSLMVETSKKNSISKTNRKNFNYRILFSGYCPFKSYVTVTVFFQHTCSEFYLIYFSWRLLSNFCLFFYFIFSYCYEKYVNTCIMQAYQSSGIIIWFKTRLLSKYFLCSCVIIRRSSSCSVRMRDPQPSWNISLF